MMLYSRLVAFGLVLVFQGRDAVENQKDECLTDCKRKIDMGKSLFRPCEKACEELFQEHKVQDFTGNPKPPSAPGHPTLVNSSYNSIGLRWNTTSSVNLTAVKYVLEILPNRTDSGVNVVYPYIEKYYLSNRTVYIVKNLEAKMNYSFRVLTVTLNGTSSFSNWSNLFHTDDSCPTKPCHVTNVRLELASHLPDKGLAHLNATLRWEPITSLNGTVPKTGSSFPIYLHIEVELLQRSRTSDHCKNFLGDDGSNPKLNKERLTNKNQSYYEFFYGERNREDTRAFYFDCWYKVEIYLRNLFPKYFISTWHFHTPECITSPRICGCKYPVIDHGHKFINLKLKRESENTSVFIYWTDERWRNDTNVTYFEVAISLYADSQNRQYQYIDSNKLITKYNASFRDLKNGTYYIAEVSAYHRDHCKHDRVERLKFLVAYPCLSNPCPINSTCQRVGYDGQRKCDCIDGFEMSNGTCQVRRNCKEDPEAEGCRGTPNERKTDNTGEIIAFVVTPVVVILVVVIAFFVIYWQRHHQKRHLARMMETVMSYSNPGSSTLTNPYDYQHPVRVPMDSMNDKRELNVLYVPQEITEAIAQGLTDGIFELTEERLNLGRVIGNGAFGEVYVGEALGIMDDPGWKTVAVKKLADSATSSEIDDFLHEIQLMKKVGVHHNVIQMYGCCTLSPPICLIMEYASGGNLLEYLKSLKRKCEKAAFLSKHPNTVELPGSEKNKFEKFFEPGEMPDASTAYSFPRNEPLSPHCVSENNVKQVEAQNVEIATRVNEEIQTALNAKELASFARQIANGMTHVANLEIIHRDLAARNILLDENKVLKISDFGLSREGDYVKKTGGKIPLRWLSIEAIQERQYSQASDVWAFGIVLWEICTLGDTPYPSVSDKDLLSFLVSGNRMRKATSCTDEIYEIMLKCWSYRPGDRPSFAELSKLLWKLEHEGNTYVNIEPLLESLPLPAAGEDDGNARDVEQEIIPETPSDTVEGIDNQAFWHSVEDLNADDEQHILPRKHKDKKAQSGKPDKDAAISAQPVGNGLSNHGFNAPSEQQDASDA